MSVRHKYSQVILKLDCVRVFLLGSEVIGTIYVCTEIERTSVHAVVILVSYMDVYVHIYSILFTILFSDM